MSRPGNTSSRWRKNCGSIEITSSKCPCVAQSLTIRILPSRSRIVALISPSRSFTRTLRSFRPSRISRRASRTQIGQRESVCRGQPSGGLVFSHDFRSGLSDQRGVKDLFGRNRLRRLNANQAPFAANESAFSKYFVEACIVMTVPHFTSKTREVALFYARFRRFGQIKNEGSDLI